jgi:hypothetical protein
MIATLIALNAPMFPWVMSFRDRLGPIPWALAWVLFWIALVAASLLWMYLGDEAEDGR